MFSQNLASQRKSIKTHTATCVHHLIPLIRMAGEYYIYNTGHKCEKGRKSALLFIFDTGYYTIVSGWGELYDIYCTTKKLGSYTDRNVSPHKPTDTDYGESRLWILPFDHAFRFIKKNITDSKHVINSYHQFR